MTKCKCTLREKVVGDGCDICNHAKALEYASERIEELEERLIEIAKFAYFHSTGPAFPDALWHVRELAYELI